MTELIFSFDTEDPVHAEGADGILRNAQTLTNAGVVGCFNTVGVLAKALKEWGREDVIEAMKKHEIDIHTNRSYFKQYWDLINFNKKNTPKEEWMLSPRHTDEEIDTFFANFATLIKMIQDDPRFHITTYRELGEKYKTERVLKKSDLAAVKAQLDEELFPVTTPDSFCLSDIFLACRDLLRGKDEHKCGFVYGFLETPYAITEPVTVTAEQMRASTKWIPEGRFLPDFIYVDDKKLGPADWLHAALAVLSGENTVTVEPAPWQIDLEKIPGITYTYGGTWLHCDNFEDNQLSKRQRLQSWTLRLPKDTNRYIL